jgi:hypothetical protein
MQRQCKIILHCRLITNMFSATSCVPFKLLNIFVVLNTKFIYLYTLTCNLRHVIMTFWKKIDSKCFSPFNQTFFISKIFEIKSLIIYLRDNLFFCLIMFNHLFNPNDPKSFFYGQEMDPKNLF